MICDYHRPHTNGCVCHVIPSASPLQCWLFGFPGSVRTVTCKNWNTGCACAADEKKKWNAGRKESEEEETTLETTVKKSIFGLVAPSVGWMASKPVCGGPSPSSSSENWLPPKSLRWWRRSSDSLPFFAIEWTLSFIHIATSLTVSVARAPSLYLAILRLLLTNLLKQ